MKKLIIGLSGPDLLAVMRALVDSGVFSQGLPTSLSVDLKSKPIDQDWVERWVPKCDRTVFAKWGEAFGHFISLDKGTVVKAKNEVPAIQPTAVLDMLTRIPFELASFDGVHREWDVDPKYYAPAFANMHWPHGWACAFKGAGHTRLVSRRWLDHGPWLVRRGPNDTTLIQFHDLEADAATALAQAKPGHERMGISMTGGFLQWPGYPMTNEISGLYVAEKRELRVVVLGRDVPESEMTDAAAMRAFRGFGDDKPIDRVIYVFMEERAARAHLHALWLRDIEVRAMIDGVETRIDESYSPVPTKPDWVKRVEARERA